MSEMSAWLNDLGLEQYSEIFAENGIELRALPHLTEQDLVDLGVLLGHRRILLSAIGALSGEPPSRKVPTDEGIENAPLAGERRQVTILFADLVGYTELSSKLDTEEVHAILGHFLDTADRIILEYGGTVDKHLGDCVMAVFGAPVAHSNDPVRAVHAALKILEAMPGVSQLAGHVLNVHLGLASGQVLASGVGRDAHYTVTGDSVNLASRLTDAAKPGEILLSQGVQMSVLADFQLLDRGEIRVKGVADPVRVYAPIGPADAAPVHEDRPFVGRQAELQQFLGILRVCHEIDSGQAIYLRGEAGIGKTRLSAKLVALAEEQQFACHRALVLDFGVGKEQSVMPTLVRSLLSIPIDSDQEKRKQQLDLAGERDLYDPGQRIFLNALLDIPQSREQRSLYDAMESDSREQGKISTLVTLLGRLSDETPQLILVEDLHWANEPLIRFLAELSKSLAYHASVLLMTSRIEGDPLDSNWKQQTETTPLTTLDLRPLRPNDAMMLAADYFDASTQFAQKCVERAEGNPLYLEQLLRSAEEMGEDQVPGSVHSIVQARLDSLPLIDKQAIQAASVLGQRFSLDELRFMIDEANYSCGNLFERYLVKADGEAYLFSHALIQEAVYQSLLRSRRAELHVVAAKWYGHREPELYAIHLDRAEDAEAARAYLEAAKSQAVDLQFDSALGLAVRGIELASQDEEKCELILIRAEMLRNLGNIESSIAVCREAIDVASQGAQLCRAWLMLVEGLRIAEEFEQVLQALDVAESIAVKSSLNLELSRIHYQRGNLFFMRGKMDDCLAEHKYSLQLAEETGSAEGKALALGGLGDAYYLRGHMRSAYDQFQACIELSQWHGLGRIEVANRHMVGWSRLFLMEFSEALVDAVASIEMAEKVGHHRAEMIGLQLVGSIHLECGNLTEASRFVGQSLELANQLNTGNFTAQALYLQARIEHAGDDRKAARKTINQALQVVREVGMAFFGPSVLAVCAALADDEAQRSEYLKQGEAILDAGCVSHNYFHFSRIAIDLALQSKAWDRVGRYAARLEDYTADQPLAWSDFLMRRGRALAAWGRGERGVECVMELRQLAEQAREANLPLMLSALDNPPGAVAESNRK